jgi:hypothetical protein
VLDEDDTELAALEVGLGRIGTIVDGRPSFQRFCETEKFCRW